MDGVLSCRTDHAICEVGTRLRVYFGGTEILCNDMVAMETTKIEPLVIYSSAISVSRCHTHTYIHTRVQLID